MATSSRGSLLVLLVITTIQAPALAAHAPEDALWDKAFDHGTDWTLHTSGTWTGSGGTQETDYSIAYHIDLELSVTLTASGPMSFRPGGPNLQGLGWPAMVTISARFHEKENTDGYRADGECTVQKTIPTHIDVLGVWNGSRIDGRIAYPSPSKLNFPDYDPTDPPAAVEVKAEDWSCSGDVCFDVGTTEWECEPFDRGSDAVVPLVHGLVAQDRWQDRALPADAARALNYTRAGEAWPGGGGAHLRQVDALATHPWFTLTDVNLWTEGQTMRDAATRTWTMASGKGSTDWTYAESCETWMFSVVGSGSCTATSEVTLTSGHALCGSLAELQDEEVAMMQKRVKESGGASEDTVLAWVQTRLGPVLTATMRYEALHESLGCPDDGTEHAEVAGCLLVRAVYPHLTGWAARDGGLGPKGIFLAFKMAPLRDVFHCPIPTRAEMDALLQPILDRAHERYQVDEQLRLEVHSPVSLHAYAPDGSHVGWNETTGAPDLDIPNATYTGRPGEAQTIILPAGLYRVVVEELAEGNFTLLTALEGDPAATTSWRMGSVSGRATATYLHLAATTPDPAGPAALDVFPLVRPHNGTLGAGFFDLYGEGPTLPPTDHDGDTEDGAEDPAAPADDSAPGAPNSTRDDSRTQPGGSGKPVPAAPWPALLALASAVAIRRRRPPCRDTDAP